MNTAIPENKRQSLERLIRIARSHTDQSRHVADFLLAWWNASENGGFDLVDAWSVDQEIAIDMLQCFALIIGSRSYPDTLGYKREFEMIWEQWRGASKGGAA